ncbi:hypothetical protein LINPERPRIM_LOCUS20305, partial [Linum perenne]
MLNLKLHCKIRYAHAQASKVQKKKQEKRRKFVKTNKKIHTKTTKFTKKSLKMHLH